MVLRTFKKKVHAHSTAQWAPRRARTRRLGAKVEEEREEGREEGREGRRRREEEEGRERGKVRKSVPKKCTFDACQNTPPAHFRRRGPMKTCEHRVEIPKIFACGAPPRPRPSGRGRPSRRLVRPLVARSIPPQWGSTRLCPHAPWGVRADERPAADDLCHPSIATFIYNILEVIFINEYLSEPWLIALMFQLTLEYAARAVQFHPSGGQFDFVSLGTWCR